MLLSNEKSIQLLNERVARSLPFTQAEYVTVVFSAADTDTPVPHALKTTNYDGINYQAVRMSLPAIIYHDASSTRTAWKSGFIYLRSTAPTTVRLLLTVE